MRPLSELEQDALRELFNIGVGRAAAMMSRLSEQEIFFDVPWIEFRTRRAAAQMLTANFDDLGNPLRGVSERFAGSFEGEAVLLFPQSHSYEIVRTMVGRQIPLEQLPDLEQDALGEVGNIILSSCVATISEILSDEIDCDVPKLRGGTPFAILGEHQLDTHVLFLHIIFSLCGQGSEGFVAFLMDAPQVEHLRDAIDRMLNNLPAPEAKALATNA